MFVLFFIGNFISVSSIILSRIQPNETRRMSYAYDTFVVGGGVGGVWWCVVVCGGVDPTIGVML